jgi:hypothetical protein
MVQSRLIRLGSLLTIIGTLLSLLILLEVYGIYIPQLFFPLYQHWFVLPVSIWFAYVAPLASDLCFLFGLVAVLVLQRSKWGRLAAGVAVLGLALGAAARGLFIWPGPLGYTCARCGAFDWYDTLSPLADVLTALGLVAGGLFTLRARVLPRWNAVPLLLGVWLAFSTIRILLGPGYYFFVFYSPFGPFAPPTPPQDLWVLILVSAISWLLWGSLGVGLWPGKNPAAQEAQPVIVPLS